MRQISLLRSPRAASALLAALAVSTSACSSGASGGKAAANDASAPGDASTSTDGSGSSDASARSDAPVDAITMTKISARGFVFDARVAGPPDGDVVILLHGFPETSLEWESQLGALARAGYRAVAPDQRGYSPGARPSGVAAYAVTELILDVVAMADAIGAARFHVVGHDWGAAVAWGVAGLAKDRVASVSPMSVPHPDAFATVLADQTSCQYSASSYFDLFTQPTATDSLVGNDASGLGVFYTGLPPGHAAAYVEALGTHDAMDAALNWYRANVANRKLTAPALGPITVPTMYIWSDGDTALCRDGADLTKDHVTGPYRFEIVRGIDHWVPEKAADTVNALLLDELAKYPLK